MSEKPAKCALCGVEMTAPEAELEMRDGRKLPMCLHCVQNIFTAFIRVCASENKKLSEGERK